MNQVFYRLLSWARRHKVLIIILTTAIVTLTLGIIIAVSDQETENSETGIAHVEPETKFKKQDFIFSAAGDFEAGKKFADTLKAVKKSKSDFMIGLGDYSYGQTSEEQWCDIAVKHLGKDFPFELLVGNHDTDTGNEKGDGFIEDYTKCLPNKIPNMQGEYGLRYYFDYNNNSRFILISPGIKMKGKSYTYKKGTNDYRWIEELLNDAKQKDIKWVVVAMHMNCITIGEKSCEISRDINNLLLTHKVDLVLQGHEHGYMRTKQLGLNKKCPTIDPNAYDKDCVTDSSQKTYIAEKGTIFSIVGTGGKNLREIRTSRPAKPYFATWSGSNINPAYGPLIITIKQDSIEATFKSNENGKTVDSFKIISS